MASRLIDTAILVDLLRGNALTQSWLDEQPQGAVVISVVIVAELLAGCGRSSISRSFGGQGQGRALFTACIFHLLAVKTSTIEQQRSAVFQVRITLTQCFKILVATTRQSKRVAHIDCFVSARQVHGVHWIVV